MNGVRSDDQPVGDAEDQELPRQLNRSLTWSAGLAAVGLLVFVAGVVLGTIDETPSTAVGAGVVVVVGVVVASIVAVGRVRNR